MRSPSDAPEREPYQRALAAILEVAQVLLTLQTVATLDAKNMRGLVVENITALLDDLQRGQHTAQRLRNRRAFDLHLAISGAEIDSGAVAYRYRQLDEAMRHVEDAFRELTAAKIDTLAVQTRSNLAHAISSAKDAFRQLANSEGAPNPALLVAIGKMRLAIKVFSHDFDDLGYELSVVS